MMCVNYIVEIVFSSLDFIGLLSFLWNRVDFRVFLSQNCVYIYWAPETKEE